VEAAKRSRQAQARKERQQAANAGFAPASLCGAGGLEDDPDGEGYDGDREPNTCVIWWVRGRRSSPAPVLPGG